MLSRVAKLLDQQGLPEDGIKLDMPRVFIDDRSPDEMKTEIISHLAPIDILSMSLVSRNCNQLAKDSLIWNRKMAIHFPDAIKKNERQVSASWHAFFKKTYNEKYTCLTTDQKKLFSLIKEGDIESINKLNIDYHSLAITDANQTSLIHFIIEHQNPRVPDYFFNRIYQQRIEKYHAHAIDKVDPFNYNMLHWSIVFNRHELFLDFTKNHQLMMNPTTLYVAAKLNRLDMLKFLLEKDIDCNLPNGNTGATPLFIAAQQGHSKVIDMLIKAGAFFNGHENSPLLVAAEENRLDAAVSLLREKSIQVNFIGASGLTPLYAAAKNGHAEMCELLLAHGADAKIPWLGYTPFYIAAQQGHLDVISALAKTEPDYNQVSPNSSTALYVASQNGHEPVVRFLCKQGARTDILYENSYSALYVACQKGHLAVAETLVSFGANINQLTIHKGSPLYVACQFGHPDIVRFLIANGANIHQQFENAYTCLHITCFKNPETAPDIINALMAAGADPRVTDDSGNTAADIAVSASIMNLMRQHENTFKANTSSGIKQPRDTGMNKDNEDADADQPIAKRLRRAYR